jgi:hypothetical protein
MAATYQRTKRTRRKVGDVVRRIFELHFVELCGGMETL